MGGISPLVTILHTMTSLSSTTASHEEALKALFAALQEILACQFSLDGSSIQEAILSCVSALQKFSGVTTIVISALQLLNIISSSTDYLQLCIDNNVLESTSNIMRIYASDIGILKSSVDIFRNVSLGDDDIAISICTTNSSKVLIQCIDENLNDSVTYTDPIHSLLLVLHRLASLSKVGCDTLRRQNCSSSVFSALEAFKQNENIKNTCLQILRLVLQESDVKTIITNLTKKINHKDFFSLKDSSVDMIEKASIDVQRLGLVLFCGQSVAQSVNTLGGGTLLQSCVDGFAPAASVRDEGSLNRRARTLFIDNCIQALGRSALGSTDINGIFSLTPIITHALVENPSIAVFDTISNMSSLDSSILEAFIQHGATGHVVKVCQSTFYSPDVLRAAFGCLAKLAMSENGLKEIIKSNALHQVCEYIMDSLMNDEINSSNVDMLRTGISVLLALANSIRNQTGPIDTILLKTLCEIIDALCTLSAMDTGVLYPDLLASTMDVVSALIQGKNGKQYASVLMDTGYLSKILQLMHSQNDAYFKHALPTQAFANMISNLARCSEDIRGYLHGNGSQEYLLRAMNFHAMNLELQKVISDAIGALGFDESTSGLATFIEQV